MTRSFGARIASLVRIDLLITALLFESTRFVDLLVYNDSRLHLYNQEV